MIPFNQQVSKRQNALVIAYVQNLKEGKLLALSIA